MRILFLVYPPYDSQGYLQKRLAEEADECGIDWVVCDIRKFSFETGVDGCPVRYDGGPVPEADIVYQTLGFQTDFLHHLFEALSLYGYQIFRPLDNFMMDKRACLVKLSQAGIAVPKTYSVYGVGPLKQALEELEAPYVFKPVRGSGGKNVLLLKSYESALHMGEHWIGARQDFLIQEALYPLGQDVRAVIIDGNVVAAMARTAAEGDFRANMSQGGSAKVTQLSAEEEAMCLKTAQVCGYPLAGVDFMRTSNGPVVLEVNKAPFLGIEQVTGVNVAGEIIALCMRMVQVKKAA